MSPRPGGEADKIGNHYEGAWTARQLLEVLAGRAESVTIEELGEVGKGGEFTLRRSTTIEVHQLKRQRGSANYWTLGDLRAEGVLDAARRHVAAGREFHFVSTIPVQQLQSLAEFAYRSPDVKTFNDNLNRESRTRFDYLTNVYGSPQAAWETLRGTWTSCTSERDIRSTNAALAGLLLRGASAMPAAVALADLAVENLATTLDKQAITDKLAQYELELVPAGVSRSVAQTIGTLHASWKASIERELLQPPIDRPAAHNILGSFQGEERLLLAVGTGGSGKSAVLYSVVKRAESDGWAVLGFRLDREEPFSSPGELGRRLGLDTSPTSGLARIAGDRPSLLVIDQLDAVSNASGRMPRTFDAVADLIREAAAFPNMRVLLACRKFDVDNDDRIRALIKDHQAEQVMVTELTDEQVVAAVEALGIVPDRLTRHQRELLRLPLHLKLLATIADQTEDFSFASTNELFDAYWERKRRDCRARRETTVRFAEVVGLLADEMSARQRLAVPASVLDSADLADDADLLASEHVLVRVGQQLAFFHETFFDYAFARRWTQRAESLVQFLLAGEQELFRRSQVRQILTYIRDEGANRFVVEVEELLTEHQVRFHIKHVALALLRALEAPTTAEWQMVERLLAADPPYAEHIWRMLRTPSWFDRLDAEGVMDAWLSGDDGQLQKRALEVMAGGGKERPDRIAEIIAPHAGSADYPAWLRWIIRFADVHESRALFSLVTESVIRCELDDYEHDLFLSVHGLGKHKPSWAIELLAAYLIDRPTALTPGEDLRVKALLSQDRSAIELLTAAAAAEPAGFSKMFVPYILKVMALTSRQREGGRPIDIHFAHRDDDLPYHELEDALTAGAVGALKEHVRKQPEDAKPLLDQLAGHKNRTAQVLLYEALTAAGGTYAEYAAALLVDRADGLYATSSWTVRLLIQAISTHLTLESFGRLERAVIEFRPSWDSQPPGRASFTFLTAMDEGRLSDTGRRRLGELRRLFKVDQPPEPEAITGGFIGSPIPQESAQRMNDDQWLGAMAKHNTDREDWRTFTGGARELSHVLKEEVKEEPGRFARLALRIGPDTHAAYTESILMGLGDSDAPVDPDLVFQAVRHIASLNNPANERWLGWGLRRQLKADVPDDLIGMLIDRALHSTEPTDDSTAQDSGNEGHDNRDRLLERGINTARGSCVEVLGNLLVYDVDGRRTSLVVPVLGQLVRDPSLAVRACTAHLIAACLRHARAVAVSAFHGLIDADDSLLGTRNVERLIYYIGNGDAAAVKPVIQRMLSSGNDRVRRAGGRLAAYAGLELTSEDLLAKVLASDDVAVRTGAATMCAGRLPHTANAAAAGSAVRQLLDDPDENVRNEAAGVAVNLRGKALQPFTHELNAVIESAAFSYAASQLLITLDRAPDRIDGLILKCARRFVDVYGADTGDIRTRAAGDAREVGELLLRAYAQARSVQTRAEVLNLLDALLLSGAYGVPELVDAVDRQ